MSNKTEIIRIDYSQLMDLRVDYAFKLIFGTGDTLFLISLLNAIFANKKIPRIIKSLTVVNPHLEKHSKEDKLSVLDIRAQLDDGTTILIEMHLYDLDEPMYTLYIQLNTKANFNSTPIRHIDDINHRCSEGVFFFCREGIPAV